MKNPKLATDPKDYRVCGYAQALAGDQAARAGLCTLFPGKSWEEVHTAYRLILFTRAARSRSKGASIAPEVAERVVAEGGQIPLGELMRFKARYFADGAVLGSKAFVAEQLAEYRRRTGRGQRTFVREMPGHCGLAMMRNLKLPAS